MEMERGRIVTDEKYETSVPRASSYVRESQGLSIYFPIELKNMEGLSYYLNYINNICSNNDIKTLYYYKLAGCLNGELQTYAYSKGYGTFPEVGRIPAVRFDQAKELVSRRYDRRIRNPYDLEPRL